MVKKLKSVLQKNKQKESVASLHESTERGASNFGSLLPSVKGAEPPTAIAARLQERALEFSNSQDAFSFRNQLVNPATLHEWIKCAFNGNVLDIQTPSNQKFKDRV